MADHLAGFELGAPLVHVKIGSADVGAGNPDQNVGRPFDFRIGNVLDPDVAGSPVNQCFHMMSLELSAKKAWLEWSRAKARSSIVQSRVAVREVTWADASCAAA